MASSFSILVRHFFGRFFDLESLSPEGEPGASLAQMLGILAAPGGFFAFLLILLTPFGWSLVGFRYFYVAFSMAVMGIIMVFEWDALFPDKRDYLILAPLPVRLGMLFLAKVGALGLLLGIFLFDINVLGVLFWPGLDRVTGPLRTMSAHAAAVTSAGLFTAFSIGSVQGLLSLLFSGALYRRISVAVRAIFMAVLVMFLFLTPLLGMTYLPVLAKQNSPVLYWFPGFWFIGLYEYLNPFMHSPALMGLAGLAIWALFGSAALFLATFLPGYLRHARKALEEPLPKASGPGRVQRALTLVVNRFLLADPVERGVFHFITQTITRSPKHRLFLATYGGLGAALVAMNMGSADHSLLRVPLILSFILISGLRAAFNFPADLRANWAFQVSETSQARAYVRSTRKWIVACAIIPLLLLISPIELGVFAWPAALFHLAFGFTLSVLLMETMFFGFRKVPFACSYLTGKGNLIGLGLLYIFGFTTYADVMARLEFWLMRQPLTAFAFVAAAAVAWHAFARWRDNLPDAADPLEFIDAGDPEVRTLELSS